MRILIKNMVCTRCKLVVQSALQTLKIPYESLELGVVETTMYITKEKLDVLDSYLKQWGLELLENKKQVLAEKIKAKITELVYHSDDFEKVILSEYLSEKLNYDYSYITRLFSEVHGISIGKFFIKKKIERVKRLIISSELNLKEISYLTKYSSVAHLTKQFKKTTGLAPSHFRQLQRVNHFSRLKAVG